MAQLIVALDVPSAEQAEELVDKLYELDVIVKIGLEALCGYPERILSYCEARDVRIFVDAKLHDIPRTVGAAIAQLVRPNVHLVNVHALGGLEMMRAAVDAAGERAAELGIEPPHVFAVTLLTSIAPEDLNELGFQGGPGENAIRLAALARDAGCAGVVCSAHEGARPQALLRRRFSHADARDSSDRQRTRRSETRHDAGAGRRGRRGLSRRRAADRRSTRSGRRRQGDPRGNVGARMSVTSLDLESALAQRGALLDGHFRLSSGRHSDRFVQKFRILEDPALLEPVARAIADRFRPLKPTIVVSAAVGGIVLVYEVARQLGTKAIFVEKENGVPMLRRGFTLAARDRALLVEDVVDDGALRTRNDRRRSCATARRSSGWASSFARQRHPEPFDSARDRLRRTEYDPAYVLLELPLRSYDEADCPQCRAGEPLTDPGSRRS